MTDDLVAMIDHASRVGIPLIRTGTNGFWLRDRGDGAFENRVDRLAERLADTALRNLWISIDFFFIDAADGRTYPCGYRGAESLGSFTAHACRTPDQACRRCDWECFRDPSELFGPLQELRRDPFGLIKNWRADSAFYRRWCQDLRYYDACDWFDGRLPPDFRRLARSNGRQPPRRP